MSKKYEETLGVFLRCDETLVEIFEENVSPKSKDLIGETNRVVRRVLGALPQDTKNLRYGLEDNIAFNRWLPELENTLAQANLLKE